MKDCVREGNDVFSATAMRPEGISSSCVRADFLKQCTDQTHSEVTIRWHSSQEPPCPSGVSMLVGVCASVPDVDFHADTHCVPVCIDKTSHTSVHMVELCSGAFGGWHKDCEFLQMMHSLDFRVLGVESCLKTAWTYTVGNNAVLVDGDASLPVDFVHSCKHLVLHTSVGSDRWLGVAGLWSPDLFVASPPCHHGLLLALVMVFCLKMARPLRKSLEQPRWFDQGCFCWNRWVYSWDMITGST